MAINVTIDSDEYGTIPFTATPDDVEEYGRAIYDAAHSGVFGKIAEYVPPPIDYVGQADAEKAQRLNDATIAIAPLQDAVDLGIATEDEIAQLNAWKNYRVEVNRVDTSAAPNISWPIPPNV
ncbi:tail fiber assembly protein [Lelliottia amnigena]|uniref:tail fiber assembly protein n=2 Tax=Lelliottia TaxID=1330545 RepID=UPI003B586BF5